MNSHAVEMGNTPGAALGRRDVVEHLRRVRVTAVVRMVGSRSHLVVRGPPPLHRLNPCSIRGFRTLTGSFPYPYIYCWNRNPMTIRSPSTQQCDHRMTLRRGHSMPWPVAEDLRYIVHRVNPADTKDLRHNMPKTHTRQDTAVRPRNFGLGMGVCPANHRRVPVKVIFSESTPESENLRLPSRVFHRRGHPQICTKGIALNQTDMIAGRLNLP